MHSWPQSSIFCSEPPPAWLLQSKSTLGHDFGFQSRFDSDGLQPGNFKSKLGRDFGLPPASMPFKMSNEGFYKSGDFGSRCDVGIGVVCEARPLFEKGSNGTFIMNLSGIHVKVTTTCSPSPVLLSDLVDFRPQECFYIPFPEVHQVVFDPRSGDSSSFHGSTCTSKRLTVLDLTKEHSLNAELNTNAPHGCLTIEDTQTVGHHREVVSAASLHYEVLANGRLLLENNVGSRVHVDLDFEFRYRLEGSFCSQVTRERDSASHARFQQPVQLRPDANSGSGYSRRQESIPSDFQGASTFSFCPRPASNCGSGFSQIEVSSDFETKSSSSSKNEPLHTTGSGEGRSGRGDVMRRKARCFSKVSQEALSHLSNTEDDLELIELEVADITDSLQKDFESVEISRMKKHLSQLEAKAKALETKGVDGIYTTELTSGKQLAKESKKNMLRRLEDLFTQMDDCFAKMKAKGV